MSFLHFAGGHPWRYDLEHIGAYCNACLELMDHWQRVLPGKVLCMQNERVISDTGAEVRRLLDHCGLALEEGCLRFFRNRRPVRTASSERVRQPIYTSAVARWEHLETELAPCSKRWARRHCSASRTFSQPVARHRRRAAGYIPFPTACETPGARSQGEHRYWLHTLPATTACTPGPETTRSAATFQPGNITLGIAVGIARGMANAETRRDYSPRTVRSYQSR